MYINIYRNIFSVIYIIYILYVIFFAGLLGPSGLAAGLNISTPSLLGEMEL
jgi:hypothetical protein